MNEINLLRYHDRSNHEIHMLLAGELSDEFFSRVVLGGKVKKVRLTGLTLSMTVLLAFLCSLPMSYYIYTKYLHTSKITPAEIIHQHIKEVISVKLNSKKEELNDPLIKEGYKKIGEISEKKGAEGQQGLLVISDYKKPVEKQEEKPDEPIDPITVPGEPAKRIPVKEIEFMPIYSGTFKIQFMHVDESEAEFIKILAKNNDLNLSMIGSDKKIDRKWLVYQLDESSSTIVAGRKATYIKSFDSSDKAMSYLTRNNLKGLISANTSVTNFYDYEVCCMSKEAAEKTARGSGVNTDKIKIVDSPQ